MTSRSDPFDDLQRMFERMNRQFERQFGESGMSVGGAPAIDVEDRGDEYVVTADLPGFERDDVTVEVEDDVLTLRAEHDAESEDEAEGQYVRRERSHRSVSRSIRLPERVEEADASATYTNGVLSVTLPKRSVDEGRSVPID